jgi:TetR/AcrR family transcriptional regulator, transcriptional repressor for nem operon
MRESPTRQALIDVGLREILAKGYDGVGIGPVLAAAGVPKGSFYHFFRSKEDFVRATIDAYAAHYDAARARILRDTDLPPLARLERYFEGLMAEAASDPIGGCFYGVLAQNTVGQSEMLRLRVRDCFDNWQAAIAEVLVEARDAGDLPPDFDAEGTAAFLIEAYEGALIRAKADGGPAALDRFLAFAVAPVVRGGG